MLDLQRRRSHRGETRTPGGAGAGARRKLNLK